MQRRLLAFVQALREHGVDVSPAEVADALQGVAALGIDRAVLRATLAASLVKTAEQRSMFDALFERFFPLPPATTERRRRPRRSDSGAFAGRANGRGDVPRTEARRTRGRARSLRELIRAQSQREAGPTRELWVADGPENSPLQKPEPFTGGEDTARQVGWDRPWLHLDPLMIEELREPMAKLSRLFRCRLARRKKRARRGSLDFRATFRKAVSSGGIFLRPVVRRRRPRHNKLVAFCDLSYSVASASEFFLALLASARPLFRRARFYGFVDSLVELEVRGDRAFPCTPFDPHARSDFGAVLQVFYAERAKEIDRNTVVLVLGDGRNNYRPPRAELLRAIHQRSRAVVWIQPEDPARWGSGDSAFPRYARHCSKTLAARTPRQLARALAHALEPYI
ncbi:MAG: hypothetical protein KatS3mg077_2851 [Candidatus Binatia bacterium]|nr:MAG: hypothetical protein KatS3mg077_2851 [Candidatus Binatia bacterium]